jgi:hypothetical protein
MKQVSYRSNPAFIRKGLLTIGAAYQPLIDFKPAYSLVRMEVLYNTAIEFCISTILVGIIKCGYMKPRQPGSSVSIATAHRLDGPAIESRWG